MKRRSALIMTAAIVGGVFSFGITHAAGVIVITQKLGGLADSVFRLDGQFRVRSLFVRDVVQLTGSVSNGTKTKGIANPVLVNDNLKVTGTVTGSVAYDNTISGLTATTVKGAIDEVGIKLSKLISTPGVSATGVRAASLAATTWKGHVSDVCATNGTYGFHTSDELTVTFVPTSETEGAYTSMPINAFHPDSLCGQGGTTGTFTGTYHLVQNVIMALPANNGTGLTNNIASSGNTLTLIDTRMSPNTVTTLTKQ